MYQTPPRIRRKSSLLTKQSLVPSAVKPDVPTAKHEEANAGDGGDESDEHVGITNITSRRRSGVLRTEATEEKNEHEWEDVGSEDGRVSSSVMSTDRESNAAAKENAAEDRGIKERRRSSLSVGRVRAATSGTL